MGYASAAETAERIRQHAAHPTWSCGLKRKHVHAWLEALWGHRPETWPLNTPPAVLTRLEQAWRYGRGVRLTPKEIEQICDGVHAREMTAAFLAEVEATERRKGAS